MEPATIAFIVYLSASILLLVILSIVSYVTSPWKGTTNLIRAVISWRSIYGLALVHLYDTSTDIAILVVWGKLAYDEVSGQKDYENVDMLSFFIPAVVSLLLYRVVYAGMYWHLLGRDERMVRDSSIYSRVDIVLILLDLWLFKIVYEQFKCRYLSPCVMQKKMQLLESVFESMPQLILQTIFLIRTFGTELAESESIWIVFASIIASLCSIVTKFCNEDLQWVVEKANGIRCSCKRCPCFSMSYIAVVVWRLCETMTRFCIFTLLWSVVGGVYFTIYCVLDFCVYLSLEMYTDLVWIHPGKKDNVHGTTLEWLWVLQSITGTPLRPHMKMNLIRFFEHVAILTLIFIFSFGRFDCLFCYDKEKRNVEENAYVSLLVIMSTVTTILEIVIYSGLCFFGIVNDHATRPVVRIVDMDKYDRTQLAKAAVLPAIWMSLKPPKAVGPVTKVTKKERVAGVEKESAHE